MCTSYLLSCFVLSLDKLFFKLSIAKLSKLNNVENLQEAFKLLEVGFKNGLDLIAV